MVAGFLAGPAISGSRSPLDESVCEAGRNTSQGFECLPEYLSIFCGVVHAVLSHELYYGEVRWYPRGGLVNTKLPGWRPFSFKRRLWCWAGRLSCLMGLL